MLIVFVIYLLALTAIVVYSARKSKSNTDFVLGGKKISGVSLAISERATGESVWLLLGLTGHAFLDGYSTIWVALGCVIGVIFIWTFMAEPLRKLTEETGALTITGLFTKKFPGSERSIGILSATIVVFFFLFYIAAQYSGAGKVFQEAFGMDALWGMILGSAMVTLYTMLGGFITVVATDVFQGILMIITLLMLPIVALFFIASNNIDIANALAQAAPEHASVTDGKSGFPAIILILSGMSWAFGYTGQPQLLARMMALKDTKAAKTAKWVAYIWTILAYIGAFGIGIIGFILVKNGALGEKAAILATDSEQILPVMVMFLLTPILAGILLSGAVSAMMSTASSQLMVCSSAVSEDLYHDLSKKKLSEKQMLWVNRILIVIVGLVAFLIALLFSDTVYGLVSYAWAGIGSSFGPAVLLLLFWKRFSKAGVFASLIGGTSSAIIWKNFLLEPTGISERLASFAIAFTLAILFSILFPKKETNS
ncbi:MAG: sodium/proline symporter [Bacteroidales bacterium]|jgi:sodium/proline symporter|nr:sodium/proline symporter [Bacteroidales bacterium]